MRPWIRHSAPATVLLVLLMFISVVLAACGGGSSSPGQTKTYTDQTYGYSFQYPSSWKQAESSSVDVSAGSAATGSMGVYDPKGAKSGDIYIDTMRVSVYELGVTIEEHHLPELRTQVEAILQNLEDQAGDLVTLTPLTEFTMGGQAGDAAEYVMNGFMITYSFPKDDIPVVSSLYFLFHGDREYQLTTQAAQENWEADLPVFEAMIDSFRPGSAQ